MKLYDYAKETNKQTCIDELNYEFLKMKQKTAGFLKGHTGINQVACTWNEHELVWL